MSEFTKVLKNGALPTNCEYSLLNFSLAIISLAVVLERILCLDSFLFSFAANVLVLVRSNAKKK